MIYRWWHQFIRRRTKPIPEQTAHIWKRRLSIAYGLLAWNAFGVMAYCMYQGKTDWAHYYGLKTEEEKNLAPAQAWAQTLGIKNAKVYRISGFSKVAEYDIIDGEAVHKNPSEKSEETEVLN